MCYPQNTLHTVLPRTICPCATRNTVRSQSAMHKSQQPQKMCKYSTENTYICNNMLFHSTATAVYATVPTKYSAWRFVLSFLGRHRSKQYVVEGQTR